MSVVAVIQARNTSVRVPGKCCMELAGVPVIRHIIDRARMIEGVEKVCVAIPDVPGQEGIVEMVEPLDDVYLVQGPDDDLARRLSMAMEVTEASIMVRIWGDCPAIDPRTNADLLAKFRDAGAAWGMIFADSGFPEGVEGQVMSREALFAVDREATDPREREGIQPFLERHPERFPMIEMRREPKMTHLKVLLDTWDDLRRLREIFETLYPANPRFAMDDLIALAERRPDLFVSDNPDLLHTPQDQATG